MFRNPYALQPHEASRIQITEPRMHANSRYAESRTRSISAPERIDAVVHENRRNAAQKTPEMWSVRFGPRFAAHGYVVEQKLAIATSNKCAEGMKGRGVKGMIPVWRQRKIHRRR